MSGVGAFLMRSLLALGLAASLGAVQTLPAQSSPTAQKPASSSSNRSNSSESGSNEQSLPVFRKSVHRVILDVVVTDGNERPVHGLSRDDFSVAEDGKPQRVLSFDVHDFDDAPEVPEVPSLPENTFMNIPSAPERGPLYVILYDMVNMRMDDQGTARTQLLNFIADKPAGARFAIFVLSDGLRMVQGFTADKRELFAAMDPKAPRPHVPKVFLYGDNFGLGQIAVIRWAFTEIAHYLDSMPGRKNVIWFTGSFPASFLPTVDPDATAGSSTSTEATNYSDEIKEAVDAMARGQIAVYPVDVRGVVGTTVKANPGGTASSNSSTLYGSYATEDDIAIATGGHAFYSSNDVKAELIEATETGGCYYTLTYSPSNQNYDGQLRRLHVELAKHGYHLAYRREYYGYNPDAPVPARGKHPRDPGSAPAATDSLFANMQHGAPLTHQLLFKAHIRRVGAPARATPEQMESLFSGNAANFRQRDKNRLGKPRLPIELQTYAIDYTVVVYRPKAIARTQPFRMEVAAAAYDLEGAMLNARVENAAESIGDSGDAMPLDAAELKDGNVRSFHRAQQLFDVPVNAKSIRLAVHEVTTDRVGAMEVALPLAREPQTQADAPVGAGSRNESQAKPE